MRLFAKLTALSFIALIVGVILAQAQCYYTQAARKNQMLRGPTPTNPDEARRNIRELREENEKHPAPINAPIDPPINAPSLAEDARPGSE